MKRYLLTGLIILLPIVITLWILFFFLDFLTEPFVSTAESLFISLFPHSHTLILLFSKLFILAAFFFLVLLLGFVGQKFFFRTLLHLTERIFSKIPLVKTIYQLLTEITKAVIKSDSKTFKGSVLLPFPMEKCRALGLLINDLPVSIQSGEKLKSVFVPTSPHPISGFLLMLSESQLTPLDLTTEEVFKILLSCGMVHPKTPEPPHKP